MNHVINCKYFNGNLILKQNKYKIPIENKINILPPFVYNKLINKCWKLKSNKNIGEPTKQTRGGLMKIFFMQR